MYLRFVTGRIDPDSGLEQGVITVANELWRAAAAPKWLLGEIRRELDWFNDRLDVPNRFSPTRRKWNQRYGICWFKPGARDCIDHARELAWMLAEADVATRQIRTHHPGELVWQDANQIVAVPNQSGPIILG